MHPEGTPARTDCIAEHLVVEGAGAVAVAAILSRKVDPALRVPVALVTGANVDLSTLLAVVRRAS